VCYSIYRRALLYGRDADVCHALIADLREGILIPFLCDERRRLYCLAAMSAEEEKLYGDLLI
jgi:hypothetical protein